MSATVRRVVAAALATLTAGGIALFATESASARPMPWRTISTPAHAPGIVISPVPWRAVSTPGAAPASVPHEKMPDVAPA